MTSIQQEQDILRRLLDGPYRWSSIANYSIKEAEIFHDDRPQHFTRKSGRIPDADNARGLAERRAINLRLVCPKLCVPDERLNEQSRLLRLPGEVRDNIWRYVMNVFSPLAARPLTSEEAFHVRGQGLQMQYSGTYRGNKRTWEADIPGYGFTFALPSGWHLQRTGVFKRDAGGRPAAFTCIMLDTAVFLVSRQIYAESYNILLHERKIKIERYPDHQQSPEPTFTARDLQLFSRARYIDIRTRFFSDVAQSIQRWTRRHDLRSLQIAFDRLDRAENGLHDVERNWIPELVQLAPIRVAEHVALRWGLDNKAHFQAIGIPYEEYTRLIFQLRMSMLGREKTKVGRRLVLEWDKTTSEVKWRLAPTMESGHGSRHLGERKHETR